MRLIIFTQHFWPENFRINSIAKYLSKNKIIKKLSIFTAKPNYPTGKIFKGYKKFQFEKKKKEKITIYRSQIIPRGNSSAINLILNYLSYVLFGLINIFRIKKKYDLVFVYCTSPIFQAIPAIIFAKINKIPVILWVQDLWPDSVQETGYIKNYFLISIIKYITKIIYNNCNLILVQSKKFVKPIKNLSKTKVKIFLNPSEFDIVKNKKFYYKKKKIKKIYYAGNLGSVQNLKNLLKFCRSTKLKNFKITLFGDGSKKSWLKQKIIELKLKDKIEVKNFIKKDNFKQTMYSADCFLIILSTGKALSKTIPAKFQTYLYFGKPIISWSNGEVSSLVDKHGLGYSAKSDSFKKFSKAIEKVIRLKKEGFKKFYFKNTKFFNNNFAISKSIIDLTNIFYKELYEKKN